jgi:predicted SnoaL-like aldol condensation-catalyzing enzyme
MDRIESAMRAVLEYNKALNRHDVPGMMGLISDECVFENNAPTPDGEIYSGKEAIEQFWHDFFRKSPNAQIKIEEIFGFGKRCIMRWKYNWVDSAGNKGHVRGADIVKVEDDAICEIFSYIKGEIQ